MAILDTVVGAVIATTTGIIGVFFNNKLQIKRETMLVKREIYDAVLEMKNEVDTCLKVYEFIDENMNIQINWEDSSNDNKEYYEQGLTYADTQRRNPANFLQTSFSKNKNIIQRRICYLPVNMQAIVTKVDELFKEFIFQRLHGDSDVLCGYLEKMQIELNLLESQLNVELSNYYNLWQFKMYSWRRIMRFHGR